MVRPNERFKKKKFKKYQVVKLLLEGKKLRTVQPNVQFVKKNLKEHLVLLNLVRLREDLKDLLEVICVRNVLRKFSFTKLG